MTDDQARLITTPFDPAAYLTTPEVRLEFLLTAIEEGDEPRWAAEIVRRSEG